ncbi:MAG: Mur ligase family protein, partial [Beijerinckiaceae bacterium]
HFSVASFNNHWGVPLTLARFSASAHYGVFEIGMNHAGEITPLVDMVKPHIAIVTTIAPVHLAHFSSTDAIADAKAEIFSGVVKGGAVIINGDIPQTQRLCNHAASAGIERIITFGEQQECAARLLNYTMGSHASDVSANILGDGITYRIGSPGKHIIMNSLAVLAACVEAGADLAKAAARFAHVTPPSGRGARMRLRIGSGAFELIDESYNANPASMKAALDNLGRTTVANRRIAVLGDMLELGPEAPAMHRNLVDDLVRNHIDTVFLSGPMMAHLWDALPDEMRGLHVSAAAQLELPLLDAIKPGDAVTVKGSLGSKMGPLVKMLIQKYPPVETKSG